MEEMYKARRGEGVWSFLAPFLLPEFPYVYQSRSPLKPVLLGFYGNCLTVGTVD